MKSALVQLFMVLLLAGMIVAGDGKQYKLPPRWIEASGTWEQTADGLTTEGGTLQRTAKGKSRMKFSAIILLHGWPKKWGSIQLRWEFKPGQVVQANRISITTAGRIQFMLEENGKFNVVSHKLFDFPVGKRVSFQVVSSQDGTHVKIGKSQFLSRLPLGRPVLVELGANQARISISGIRFSIR